MSYRPPKVPLVPSVVVLIAASALSAPALAKDGFWSRYHVGVSYEVSTNYAAISYDAPRNAPLPDDCEPSASAADQMRCTAYLGPSSDDASYPSLYLESPLQRRGLWYFDYGLSFATLSYTGGLVTRPGSGPVPSRPSAGSVPGSAQGGPPLQQAYLELYGINWQGYLRGGLTPRYLPDLLLTVGVGLQTVGGRVKILRVDSVRFLAQPEVFGEIEVVVLRAFGGALSGFVARDTSLLGGVAGRLVDDYPDGSAMRDFQLGLSTAAAGVNLLLPF